MIDGVNVLVEGLRAKLDADKLDSWRSTFRRGQIYNHDGGPAVQCRRQPSVAWQHGPDLIRFIRQVRSAQRRTWALKTIVASFCDHS